MNEILTGLLCIVLGGLAGLLTHVFIAVWNSRKAKKSLRYIPPENRMCRNCADYKCDISAEPCRSCVITKHTNWRE